MNVLKVLGVVLVLGIIAFMIAYPSYSWHQKMTIEIETPDGPVSGSSVVAVKWSARLVVFESLPFYDELHGEATVVALPDGRYIFALLNTTHNEEYTSNLATQTLYDTTKRQWSKEAFRRVTKLKKPMFVPPKLYPLLVTFTDINDPTTVQLVEPDDMAATFGEGYALKSITLEITDEPVTRGRVEKLLRWIYSPEKRSPKNSSPGLIKDRAGPPVHRMDFIDLHTLAEGIEAERIKNDN